MRSGAARSALISVGMPRGRGHTRPAGVSSAQDGRKAPHWLDGPAMAGGRFNRPRRPGEVHWLHPLGQLVSADRGPTHLASQV